MVKHANKARRDKGRLQPFVPLLIETLDTPAWRAMSHGAKALYVCLKRRCFAPDNNGRVYLSYRKAREQLRSGTDEIGRWFRELEHYGFIVQTEPGYLGVEGLGRSPHWRLTELGTRDLDGQLRPPTRDFVRWDGTKFSDSQKQNPVPENRYTPYQKRGTPPYQKTGTVEGQTVPENGDIQRPMTVPENGDITIITTRGAKLDSKSGPQADTAPRPAAPESNPRQGNGETAEEKRARRKRAAKANSNSRLNWRSTGKPPRGRKRSAGSQVAGQ